eukprot:g3971.t1
MNVVFLVLGWHYMFEKVCYDDEGHQTMDTGQRRTYRTLVTVTCLSVSVQLILQCRIFAESLKTTIMEEIRNPRLVEQLAFAYCGLSAWILLLGFLTTGYNYNHIGENSKCAARAIGSSPSSTGGAVFLLLMWVNISMHLLGALPQSTYYCVASTCYRTIGRPICWLFGFRDSEFAVLQLVGQRWSAFLEPIIATDITLTPSDFVAAFAVLGRNQQESRREKRRRRHTSGNGEEILTNDVDVESCPPSIAKERVMLLADAQYFVRYALGAYGWVLESYMLLLSPLRAFRFARRWFRALLENYRGRGKNGDNLSSDYFPTKPFDNLAALCRQTGLHKKDVCHVSFENDGLQKPWFVALDRRRRCVVVSVRGSLSAVDVITDMAFMNPSRAKSNGGDDGATQDDETTAFAESLAPYAEEFGFAPMSTTAAGSKGTEPTRDLNVRATTSKTTLPEGSAAHYGILKAAVWIARDIRSRGAIDGAFARICTGRNAGRATAARKTEYLDEEEEEESATLLRERRPSSSDESDDEYRLVLVGHSLGAGIASLLAVLLRPTWPDLECIAFSPPGGLMSPALSLFSRSFIRSIVLGDDMIPRISLTNFDLLRDRVIECGCVSAQKKFYLPLSTSNRVFCPENVPRSCKKFLEDYRRAVGRQRTLSPDGLYDAKFISGSYLGEIVMSMNMMHDHMPDVLEPAIRRALDRERTAK